MSASAGTGRVAVMRGVGLTHGTFQDPPLARWLLADTRSGLIWLVLRVWLGLQWLEAGIRKLGNPAWTGEKAGTAVTRFLQGALAKTSGDHPDVQGWYAWFIERVALPNAKVFSYLVAYGEVMVGTALILGLLTGIAAFFASFMNANFLFAGAVSNNPLMFIVAILIILAWRVAGWYGLDRWVLPALGTPWQPGSVFRGHEG